MLSQPDSELTPETAGDAPIPASGDTRAHTSEIRDRTLACAKTFLHETFVIAPRLLLAGKYDKRKAGYIIAAACPILLAVLFMTVPSLLFPTPQHNAFFHFANIVATDAASTIPILLGIVSTTLGLRMPLHS